MGKSRGRTIDTLKHWNWRKLRLIPCLALFGTELLLAAPNQGLALSLQETQGSKWSGNASVGILSSTMNPDEAEYVSQALFSADFSAMLFDGWTTGAGLRANKDLNNEQVNRLSSAYFLLNRRLYKNDQGLDSNLGLYYYLPVEKTELRYDTYRGAVAVTPAINYSWGEGQLRGLSVLASMNVMRRFYRYTSNQGGYPLVKESFTTSIGATYTFATKWGLGVQFANTQAWDFDGEPFRSEYSSTQTITYNWSELLSFAVGHTTGGYTFNYGGADYDIRFYDRYTSKVFGSVAYSI
ncbi:MAG: hypothetical protein ACOH5I_00190 [Oligoflexus sp.]